MSKNYQIYGQESDSQNMATQSSDGRHTPMTSSQISSRDNPGRLNPSFITSSISGTPSSSQIGAPNDYQLYQSVPSSPQRKIATHGIDNEIELNEKLVESFNDILSERSRAKGNQKMNDLENFPQSKWRWVNLASIFLALASSASCMTTFSSVSRQVAEGYGTSIVTVNTSTIVYFASYILSNFPSTYLIEAGKTQGYGLMISFKLGALATMIGCWGRYFITLADDEFSLILIPQTICGIAQPFLVNGISKLALIWFGDDQRAVATSIVALATPVGCMIGLGLGPAFIHNEDRYNPDNCKRHVGELLWIQGFITMGMCIPILLFYRQKPQQHPSRASFESDTMLEKNYDIKLEFRQLMKNRNYIILLLIFTLQYSVYTCLAAVMNSITSPYHYTPVDASLMGFSFVVFGVSGGIIFSIMLDKYQCYLKTLQMINIGCVIMGGIAYWGLPSGSVIVFCINIGLIGLFLLPIIAVGFAFCAELAYPNSDSLSSGLMMLVSQIFGTFVSYLASYLIETVSPLAALTLFQVQFVLSLLLSFFLKEDLRRLNAGKATLKDKNYEGKLDTI